MTYRRGDPRGASRRYRSYATIHRFLKELETEDPAGTALAYLVTDDNGRDVSALLVDGVVMPSSRCAYCIYQIPDGSFIVHTVPLTAAGVRAHNAHPDTFFGVIRPINKLGQTSIEMFSHCCPLTYFLRKKLIELLFASQPSRSTCQPTARRACHAVCGGLPSTYSVREQTLAQRRDSSAR